MNLFEDAQGNVSMMRLLAFLGFWIGAFVIGFGIVGWFTLEGGGPEVIAIGAGLAGGGELFKMIQRKFEK